MRKNPNNAKEIGTKALEVVSSAVSIGSKALASYAGEALSACETRKAVSDIQARGELYNLERQAMREMPILALNQTQALQLESQTFNGFGMYPGPIQLDSSQAESIMLHMLKQHSLDPESRRELAEAVTPLVGIPTLMQSVCHAHKILADTIVIPIINERKRETNIPCFSYRNIVDSPLYWGNNQGITLQYNVHSVKDSEMVKQQYDRSGQYTEQTREILKNIGVQIDRIESKGILLRIHLKWA